MNKNIQNKIKLLMRDINSFVVKDLPRIVGKEAVDEFRGNFHRQGFRNNGVTPWKDVKRRDPKSPWYGFNYKGERRDKSKVQKGKKKRRLNFSPAATKRGILISSSELMRSIHVASATPLEVIVGSDLVYSEVHNEGGLIRVFGKAQVQLPRRQFIGESAELLQLLDETLITRIDKIVDKHIK